MSLLLQFLVNFALLALLVGVPTAFIRLNSKRTLSLKISYYKALAYIFRFVGLAGMAIAGLVLFFALSDQVGFSHFGYTAWSIPVSVLFIIVSYGIRRVASWRLRADRIWPP
jgi:hypothetical protein